MSVPDVAGIVLIIAMLFVMFVLVPRIRGKPKPIKNQAKVPESNIHNNCICDMKVGEKGVVCCDIALFVDREYQCWIDTRWETSREWTTETFEDPNLSDLGAVEVTRTETGYAVKLLTPDYKLRVRSLVVGDRFIKPVEKFEVVKEDT